VNCELIVCLQLYS